MRPPFCFLVQSGSELVSPTTITHTLYFSEISQAPQVLPSDTLLYKSSCCHRTLFFFQPSLISSQSFLLNRRKQLSRKASAVTLSLMNSFFPLKPPSWNLPTLCLLISSSCSHLRGASTSHPAQCTCPASLPCFPGKSGISSRWAAGVVCCTAWGRKHPCKRTHPLHSQRGRFGLQCNPCSPTAHVPLPTGTRHASGFPKVSEKSRI